MVFQACIDVNYVFPITFEVGQIRRKCKSKRKRKYFTLLNYIAKSRHTREQGLWKLDEIPVISTAPAHGCAFIPAFILLSHECAYVYVPGGDFLSHGT